MTVTTFGRSETLVADELACNALCVRSRHIRIGGRGQRANQGGPWLYCFTGRAEDIARISELFPAISLFPGIETDVADLEQGHADWLTANGTPPESEPRRVINILRQLRNNSGESFETFDISS